jgi:sugar phosphate permease
MAHEKPAAVPLAEVIREHPRALIGGTFAVVACFALFYLGTAFARGHGTTALGYPRERFLLVQLGASLFLAGGIIAAGYMSDASSPRRVLMLGALLTVPAGLLLGPMMGAGSLLLIWLFLSMSLAVMGLTYGPLGAFLPSLFPARVRYTGASMAFNIGGILGGGLTPIIAQALAEKGGLMWVGFYLAAAGLISLIALAPMRNLPEPE